MHVYVCACMRVLVCICLCGCVNIVCVEGGWEQRRKLVGTGDEWPMDMWMDVRLLLNKIRAEAMALNADSLSVLGTKLGRTRGHKLCKCCKE